MIRLLRRTVVMVAAVTVTACGPSIGPTVSLPATTSTPAPAPSWHQLNPASSPLPRNSAGIAFDAADGTVVMSGGRHGCGGTDFYSDTWTWNGAAWAQQHPANSGPAELIIGSPIAYDPTTKTVVVIGHPASCGMGTTTWQWDGSNWSSTGNCADAAGNPLPNGCVPWGGSMAFDGATGVLTYWTPGDDGVTPSTWTWDGHTWSRQHPAATPPGGLGTTTMFYDAAGKRLILYSSFAQSMWAWDGTTWSQLPFTAGPSARVGAATAYDPDTGQLILFGGVTAQKSDAADAVWVQNGSYILGRPLDDLWTWDASGWHQLHPSAAPSARFSAQMVYDPVRKEVVLFGGALSATVDADDTWVYGTSH